MTRVLFTLPFLPYPLSSGGHQAIFNGLSAAASAGVEIYLTYPNYDDREEDRRALAEALGGEVTILPYQVHINRKGDQILNVIYRLKYILKRLIKGESAAKPIRTPYEEWMNQMMPKDESYCRFINEIVKKHQIDIVQCEMLETLAFVLTLPPGIKKYFVHHELGFVRKGLHPILKQEPLAGSAHLAINKAIEVDLLNHYDTVITLSEIDTKKLQEAGVATPIHTSFATINRQGDVILEATCGTELTFVGPEMHPSNKEGIRWFLDNCWEQLLNENPAYRLRIVGIWTEETQREICTSFKNVQFTGYVPDLAATIKNTVMIVPITIGSGIRMKILEAGLIGVPVVTTTVGVEGIPLVDGQSCYIADSPELFIQRIRELADQPLRERFIQNAQQTVVEHYSQQALNDNRKSLYL